MLPDTGERYLSTPLFDDVPVEMTDEEIEMSWCEFCWSVRKMMDKSTGPSTGQIRSALQARTSVVTIPQIFVGGEFVGGATDVFDAFKEGRLQTMLRNSSIAYHEGLELDPYDFLPGWLHPR